MPVVLTYLLVCLRHAVPALGMTIGACLPGSTAAAAVLAPLLSEYSHTSWGPQDGAPSDVVQFAQTTDGWLWVASPNGLFRFDGVRFARQDSVNGQRLLSTTVVGLLATPDGGLWIGHRFGGVSHIKDGRVTLYRPGEGLPDAAVFSLARGPDGAIWASTTRGLGYLAPGAQRFIILAPDTGLPRAPTHKVLFTRDGRQWVATEAGMYYREPGAARYQPAWPRVPVMAMALAPDGTLWASDGTAKHYRMQPAPPPGNPAPQPIAGGTGMHFDRDGHMWVLKSHALERRSAPYVPAPAAKGRADGDPAQQLDQHNGLRGSFPQMWFQDREGNIWIGSSTGVHRLRRKRARSMVLDTALDRPTVIADAGGQVLIGDGSGALHSADANGMREAIAPITVFASCRTQEGVIWIGNDSARWRRDPDGRWTRFDHPAALQGYHVMAMLPASDGSMWVSMRAHGLYRIDGDRWQRNGGLTGLPAGRPQALASDAAGRIWLSYVDGQVASAEGGKVRVYGQANGLRLGNVQSLLADGPRLWAGGEYGIAYFAEGRWVSVAAPLRGVSGIARTADGELWLHGAEGVSRIAAAEVERLLAHPGSTPRFERFDGPDGLGGGAEQVSPLPSLTQGSDGRLWFATPSQVTSLDPRRIPRNALAPPVQIVSLQAHGRSYEGTQIELPVGTDELEISYTALGLLMPERMRFRYRLHGLDREWHDAGNRRDVFFNNLGPGTYRFQVTAANEDGVWNSTGAQVTVTIPPRFVQTRWFLALVGLLCALLLYGLYRLRLRQLTQRMNDLAHARLAERARIARGLHDTLLQSVQGLIMFFNQQARRLPHDSEERHKIDQTLALADQLMTEGRDYILDLRAAAEPRELSDALRDYGKVLLQERLAVLVRGRPRALLPHVRDELFAIAREALFNCARHAEASKVELIVEYGAERLHVTVRDDGRGGACERSGHYGLCGMRERAIAIGAMFTLVSQPGRGTALDVVIADKQAYLHRAGPGLLARVRRRLSGTGAA